MKISNLYLNRLFKLYYHLGLYYSNEPLIVSKGNSKINHTSQALNVLPHIFKQWESDENGNARLKEYPELGSLTAAGYFFNLSTDELFNLFVPKYNEEFFGSVREINEKANMNDLRANLIGFIHVKQEYGTDLEFEKEKNKSLTTKTKYYEKQHGKYSVSQLWA